MRAIARTRRRSSPSGAAFSAGESHRWNCRGLTPTSFASSACETSARSASQMTISFPERSSETGCVLGDRCERLRERVEREPQPVARLGELRLHQRDLRAQGGAQEHLDVVRIDLAPRGAVRVDGVSDLAHGLLDRRRDRGVRPEPVAQAQQLGRRLGGAGEIADRFEDGVHLT